MGPVPPAGQVCVEEEGAAPPHARGQAGQHGRASALLYWAPAAILISAWRARKCARPKTVRQS
eukprot:15453532-Alexandrium_andersonii.AAC.1